MDLLGKHRTVFDITLDMLTMRSVTPLTANFSHIPGLDGHIELS